MKRIGSFVLFVLVAGYAAAAPQIRFAVDSMQEADSLPSSPTEWQAALAPSAEGMGGWHWEILLDQFGFGMHYGIKIYETELIETPRLVDWKGDFFLSYHPFGGGSTIDPFMSIAWGSAGTSAIADHEDSERDYRASGWDDDWDDEDDLIAAALYTSVAAGVALDLNGLLLGVRVAHRPASLIAPLPDHEAELFELSPFEIGIFGGIAIGGHGRSYWKHHYRWHW